MGQSMRSGDGLLAPPRARTTPPPPPQHTHTHTQLLAYRAGTFDPGTTLARLEPSLRDLVGHMIHRDPGARLQAGEYLRGALGAAAFPAWMPELLHPFFAPLVHAGANRRVALACAALPGLYAKLGEPGGGGEGEGGDCHRLGSAARWRG